MDSSFKYKGSEVPAPVGIALYFPASALFTIPVTGWYRIDAIGPGGAGGGAGSGAANSTTMAVGGGGGGYCNKTVRLTAGTVLDIFIGAAGTCSLSPNYTTGANTSVNGNAGGDVRVTGGGVALRATGGLGGTGNWNVTSTITGAAGGIGYGGDFNSRGGKSGDAQTSVTSGSGWVGIATGGGCAGHPYGDGAASLSYTGVATSQLNGGHGFGVSGGVNGFALDTSFQSQIGPHIYQATDATITRRALIASTSLPLLHLNGLASLTANIPGGPGAGTNSGQSQIAGIFGGGGAYAGVAGASNYVGSAGYFGGGGGACTVNSQVSNTGGGAVQGGGGGKGLVVIERVA